MANEMPNRDAVVARIREVALPPEIHALLKEGESHMSQPAVAMGNSSESVLIRALIHALRASATAQQQAEQRAKILDGIIARTLHTLGADEWETADGLALLRMTELRQARLRAEQAEQAREALKEKLEADFYTRIHGALEHYAAKIACKTLSAALKAAQDGSK